MQQRDTDNAIIMAILLVGFIALLFVIASNYDQLAQEKQHSHQLEVANTALAEQLRKQAIECDRIALNDN